MMSRRDTFRARLLKIYDPKYVRVIMFMLGKDIEELLKDWYKERCKEKGI